MNAIKQWFKDLWNGFVEWLVEVIILVLTFLKDVVLTLFELLLDGIVFVFEAISPPEFLTNGLGSLFSALPDALSYMLMQSGLAEGLAIFGAGVTFRLLRKLFTLGQW
ncbi:MAG: hypothetical protein CL577_07605 [Alteromonadaceae bacterium]|nr:hypothetical protein [Alteromonadaceae bacterium]|tara:strand:- start:2212 stop:2535 length:324 start_codon:yes stop_codon:yes gene_type:complete